MMRTPLRLLASLGWVLTASVTIGVFAAPGCGNSNQKTAMEQKKPLGAGSPDSANAKLEKTIKQKLETDARLRDAKIDVSADVTRNAVTLTGTAPSEETRRRAVELAREAQAGVLVNDRIQIKGGDSRAGTQRGTSQ
jgi:osmotically-inducible protein OsmY